MRRASCTLGFAIALAATGAAAAPATEQGRFTLRGTVHAVIDGDTLRVRLTNGKRERVRLVGIDAPERGQCFAAQAAARARTLSLRRRVTLVGDLSQPNRDRSGRLLAYVRLPDGADLGLVLVRGGYAGVFRRDFVRFVPYVDAELTAIGARLGRWRSCPSDTGVAIADSPDPVAGGQRLTYTIVVTNTGTGPAVLPALVVHLDKAVQIVSATATGGWFCSTVGDEPAFVVCTTTDIVDTIETLEPNASRTVTMVVVPSIPGVLTAEATATDARREFDDAKETTTVSQPLPSAAA